MMLRHLILSRIRFAVTGLLLGVLSACVVGPARESVDSLTGLNSDETIVVGRVDLVPPLHKDEQKFKGIIIGDLENKIFLITDYQYRVLKQEPGVADYSGQIEATLGKNFFVRSDNKPFFILVGMLYLDLGGNEMNRAYFPGGLKVALKPGDKAVYVGTIQYHRNEFFEVTKTVIIDDFARANAEFKQKFGAKYPLRKALLATVK